MDIHIKNGEIYTGGSQDCKGSGSEETHPVLGMPKSAKLALAKRRQMIRSIRRIAGQERR